MGTRKKGSELVFNLQWKNMPDNGGDRSNVVGMYDTPATTLNFETFKSYLLKNSGVVGNDVKVTYLTDNGAEWVIDSQEWFEIALCAFRLKARLGEVIFLKLDKMSSSNHHQMTRKYSNDVETQSDHDSTSNDLITPPEWFLAYMNQFKREVVEEVTCAVSAKITANSKEKESNISVHRITLPSTQKPMKPESSADLATNSEDKEGVPALQIIIPTNGLKLMKPESSTNSTEKENPSVPVILPKKVKTMNTETSPRGFVELKNGVVASVRLAPTALKKVPTEPSSNLTTNSKEKETTQAVHQIIGHTIVKKMKPESSKRSRKHMILGETPIDKELLKTLKFDRKLEIKLDKLDAKTKKIKEKKQALISKLENSGDARFNVKQSQVPVDLDGTPLLNASLVNESTNIPHMVGGETYLHTWEVINNGKLPWTSETELRLTWGSAEMKPFVNVIRCPPLQPGEKGTISVRFEIPRKPGQYESYWNFYDRNVRFGHWLSCCVIVDIPINYISEKAFTKKAKIEQQEQQQKVNPETQITGTPPPGIKHSSPEQHVSQENFMIFKEVSETEDGAGVIDLSRRMQDIKIEGTSQVDSDSDWESLWSYAGARRRQGAEEKTDDEPRKSNKYGINEKDLIVDLSKTKESKSPSPRQSPTTQNPIVETSEVDASKEGEQIQSVSDDNNNNGSSENNNSSGESICEIGSEASDLSSGYDVISGPACEEGEDSGYVYITIDGNKLPVPKHILRPDFLDNAEEAPGPINTEDEKSATADNENKVNSEEPSTSPSAKLESQIRELEQDIQETKSFMSHCSAAGTCFSDVNSSLTPGGTRFFVFPQNNPGFEVVYPKLDKEVVPGETVVSCPANRVEAVPTDPLQAYNWAHSDTQYTFADVQNACSEMSPTQLRYDPYGPLDQSRPTSSQGSSAGQNQTTFQHVPNYQQSKPRGRYSTRAPTAPPQQSSPPPPSQRTPSSPVQNSPPSIHLLPENLVSGAVNVASSAINTARSVISMIVPPKPEPGKWVNGHWVTENVESIRAKNLCILADMGFWDTDLNATLLARYNDDVSKVVSELVQQ